MRRHPHPVQISQLLIHLPWSQEPATTIHKVRRFFHLKDGIQFGQGMNRMEISKFWEQWLM